ncbi:unnamed protein product [Ilex paraguariensis]|uniref:Uncharacterized protein n=1 Tax=Ilex paraguariensis TaxID=185542 RepID=A0ABC8R6V3_9AQUA
MILAFFALPITPAFLAPALSAQAFATTLPMVPYTMPNALAPAVYTPTPTLLASLASLPIGPCTLSPTPLAPYILLPTPLAPYTSPVSLLLAPTRCLTPTLLLTSSPASTFCANDQPDIEHPTATLQPTPSCPFALAP